MTIIIYDNGSTYEIDEQQIYDPFPDVGDGQKEKEKDDEIHNHNLSRNGSD